MTFWYTYVRDYSSVFQLQRWDFVIFKKINPLSVNLEYIFHRGSWWIFTRDLLMYHLQWSSLVIRCLDNLVYTCTFHKVFLYKWYSKLFFANRLKIVILLTICFSLTGWSQNKFYTFLLITLLKNILLLYCTWCIWFQKLSWETPVCLILRKAGFQNFKRWLKLVCALHF